MTQENKDLLLRDLCERQMYNVKCKVFDDANPYTLSGVLHNKPYSQLYFEELDWKECDGFVGVEYCKPYLFPLSSMTEEQMNELLYLRDQQYFVLREYTGTYKDSIPHCIGERNVIHWCYKNHFDIHELIPMGLAIDATGLNIY